LPPEQKTFFFLKESGKIFLSLGGQSLQSPLFLSSFGGQSPPIGFLCSTFFFPKES